MHKWMNDKIAKVFVSRVAFIRNLLICPIAVMTISMPIWGQRNVTPNIPTNAPYIPSLTFNVTSVRECPPGDHGQRFVNPPHSSRLDGSGLWVVQLIGWAYGVDWRSQIFGSPDWAQSTRFNIQATSDSLADDILAKLSDDQSKLEKQHMLQALLADRFRLKAHMETKQLPVFALMIAKHGPRLKREGPMPSNSGKANEPRYPRIGTRGDPQGIAIVAHGASMADFIELLQFYLRKTVFDETGLTGNYDFTLQFHGTLSDMGDNEDSKWPPVETAIQEQLGLQLKETKGPVKVLVIDRLDKPSEN